MNVLKSIAMSSSLILTTLSKTYPALQQPLLPLLLTTLKTWHLP